MVGGIAINLFDFQEKAVLKLIDLVADSNTKQTITVKSPTGSGKTIILIDFVEEYLTKINSNAAFIWLCPGKGDLEEQSRKKMRKFAPHRHTQNLFDALQGGFPAESTTFINWELVTKKDNTSLRDGEKKNLFDRIAEAHRNNTEFIIIIDEEHSNNTAKAKTIIDAFSAKNIIRVSATAIENKRFEYFEIDEVDVINAGLITKALYVNEGITEGMEVGDDYDCLLDLADEKRKNIASHYTALDKNIRPLVLIQFPNAQPETIVAVEKKLESMQTAKVKTILERLFRKGGNMSKNLVALDTREFYAFVINNEHKLKQDFHAVTTGMAEQMSFVLKPKTTVFHIPEQDFFKYDPNVKNEVEYLSNAYHDYTLGFATSVVRSSSEMFFEQHCEKREDIEWVYKNGDSGQQYFSIVYIDGLRHQWLFYADYIVKKKDGTIWIIETKGGESKGKNKNIDDQIENKFK